jgi:hypothetical protein
MTKFDLSNNSPNKDPYILWRELATRVRNNKDYNQVVSVTVMEGYLQIQFEGHTKLYFYRDKHKIASLLSRQDAEWWLSQPF